MTEAKFWQRVAVTRTDDCWLWQRSVGSHGYGQTFWRGHVTLAHRVAYQLTKGTIPWDLVVDHICRNRRCVNPRHLRLLSNIENAHDNGMTKRTCCPIGHPYDEVNTYYRPSTGHRVCRACARVKARRRYLKRGQEARRG